MNELVTAMREQLAEQSREMAYLRKENSRLERIVHNLAIGDDIERFHDKADAFRRELHQHGEILTAGHAIFLFIEFYWLSKAWVADSIGRTVGSGSYDNLVYRFEQAAQERMYRLAQGNLIPIANPNRVLEDLIYPAITVEINGEHFTWKQLREKCGHK